MEQSPAESFPFRNPLHSTKDFLKLPEHERHTIIEETATDMLETLEAAGYVPCGNNLESMVRHLHAKEAIVRREDPVAVLKAIRGGILRINFPHDERYSNAVTWELNESPKGMENAFLEGYGGANGVVSVIGVKPDTLDVKQLDDARPDFFGLDRRYVVSALGDVPAQNILFVMVRTPIHAFPEKWMSPTEQDRLELWNEQTARGLKKLEYITRCFVNNNTMPQSIN